MIRSPNLLLHRSEDRVQVASDMIMATAGLFVLGGQSIERVGCHLPFAFEEEMSQFTRLLDSIGWGAAEFTATVHLMPPGQALAGTLIVTNRTRPFEPPRSPEEALDAYVNAAVTAEAVVHRRRLEHGVQVALTVSFPFPPAFFASEEQMQLLIARAMAKGWQFREQSSNVLWFNTRPAP